MNTPSISAIPDTTAQPYANGLASSRLGGVVVPLATPLAAIDAIDVTGLERLIDHVIVGGVHAIFILGTTGEGPSLSHNTQRSLVRHVMRQVADRVPVLVGITDPSFIESLAMAEWAASVGAAAVVAAPPFYFPTAQDPLITWTRELAGQVPLPLFLYNIPEMAKVRFEGDTLRALADCPNIIGIKDSSDDMDYFADMMQIARERRPDWSILVGSESRFSNAYSLGCHGVVPGGANVAPKLFVDLHASLVRGDTDAVNAFHAKVCALGDLYSVGTMPGRVVVGIKTALAELGICSSLAATPFERLTIDQQQQVRVILATLGL